MAEHLEFGGCRLNRIWCISLFIGFAFVGCLRAGWRSPNDPSSATRPTRAFDCNRDAMAGRCSARLCENSKLFILENEKGLQITLARNKNAPDRKCVLR